MKNRKGFTLIELIAVIIILGLIIMIAVPFFQGSLDTFREDYYKSLESSIINSTRNFFSDNRIFLPNRYLDTQKITLDTLISEKYLSNANDYNGNSCNLIDSYAIVSKTSKDKYEYAVCIKCEDDDFENTKNVFCSDAWDPDKGFTEVVFEAAQDVAVPLHTDRNKLKDLVKVSPTIRRCLGNPKANPRVCEKAIKEVSAEGETGINYIYPINIDNIDTNKIGEYTVNYRYDLGDGKIVPGRVIVYESTINVPNGCGKGTEASDIKLTKDTRVYDTSSNDLSKDNDGVRIALSPYDATDSNEWAQKLIIEFSHSYPDDVVASYHENELIVARYQWFINNRWEDICIPGKTSEGTSSTLKNYCKVTINKPMNLGIKFRYINSLGIVSKESSVCNIRIDNVDPKECTIKLTGTKGDNDWYVGNVTVEVDKKEDNVTSGSPYTGAPQVSSGIPNKPGISYGVSLLKKTEIKASNTQKDDTRSVTWYGYLEDYAKKFNKCSRTFKKDATKPKCSITGHSTLTCSDATSGLKRITFSKTSNNTTSASFALSPNPYMTTWTKTGSVTSKGRWYLRAVDDAGRVEEVSDDYYQVTYDVNGGTNLSKSSDIVRKGNAADLTPTATKAGYVFKGWHTLANSEEGLKNYNVNGDVTLYAAWLTLCSTENNVTSYTSAGEKSPYTANADSLYRVEMCGAKGGGDAGDNNGGKGAKLVGDVFLKKGDQIKVIVGGNGKNQDWDPDGCGRNSHSNYLTGGSNGGGDAFCSGSGGGRTSLFIVKSSYHSINSSTEIAAAAGGGGTTYAYPGGNGRISTATGHSVSGKNGQNYQSGCGEDGGGGGAGWHGGVHGYNENCSNGSKGFGGINGFESSKFVLVSEEGGKCTSGYAKITRLCRITPYLLTYDNEGGTGCTSKQGVIGQTWGELCTPYRNGYIFNGWYKGDNGTGDKFTENAMCNGNITVHAKWKQGNITCAAGNYLPHASTTCSICLKGNYCPGGSFSPNPIDDQGITPCPVGNSVSTIPSDGSTTLGYTSNPGSSVVTQCYVTVSENKYKTSPTSSVTTSCPTGYGSKEHNSYYQASDSCSANSYTISFNGNESTGGSTANKTCTYDANCTLTSNGFTKTGYEFDGWATSKGGSVAYSNGQTVINLASSGTVTLYAKWKLNVVAVTLNNQSATSAGTTIIYEKYNEGWFSNSTATTAITSITNPAKNGKIFSGYYTRTGGAGDRIINPEGVITGSNKSFTADTTLYAYWTDPAIITLRDNNTESSMNLTESGPVWGRKISPETDFGNNYHEAGLYGLVAKGFTRDVEVKANVAGTFSISSANTNKVKVETPSLTAAANTYVTFRLKGVESHGSPVHINIYFTPNAGQNRGPALKVYYAIAMKYVDYGATSGLRCHHEPECYNYPCTRCSANCGGRAVYWYGWNYCDDTSHKPFDSYHPNAREGHSTSNCWCLE